MCVDPVLLNTKGGRGGNRKGKGKKERKQYRDREDGENVKEGIHTQCNNGNEKGKGRIK